MRLAARPGPASPSSSAAKASASAPLADARRPVEEVGVRRPLRERRREQALRLLLLGNAVEAAARQRTCAQLRRESRATSSAATRRVEDDDPLRERARRARGRPVDTRSRNAAPSRLDAVGPPGRPPRACSTGSTSRNVRSGSRPPSAGLVQLEHGVDAEPAGDALVGERGVEEAVAHDVRAALERRPDHLRDELRAGGREERRLGPGRDRAVAEQELADPLPELRPARLARRDDLPALGAQRLGEQRSPASTCPSRRCPRSVTNTARSLVADPPSRRSRTAAARTTSSRVPAYRPGTDVSHRPANASSTRRGMSRPDAVASRGSTAITRGRRARRRRRGSRPPCVV